MQSALKKVSLVGLLGAGILLTACGGGGGGGGGSTALTYNGATDPVVIDSTNAEAVGVSVAENAAEAVDQEGSGVSNPFAADLGLNSAGSPLSRKITEVSRLVLASSRESNLPVGVTYNYSELNSLMQQQGEPAAFCGGSVSITDALFQGTSESGSMTFSNLCFDMNIINPPQTGEVVMNGSVSISVNGTTETTSFSNFTITYQGETFSFSGTEVCSTVYPYECSTLYVGGDGETYMVADVYVSGDNTSGYDVSATFYNPTYGSVDVATTDPITFCGTGHPDGGTINFTGGGGTYGSITFRTDCSGYDGTYFDGAASGVFSGDWV